MAEPVIANTTTPSPGDAASALLNASLLILAVLVAGCVCMLCLWLVSRSRRMSHADAPARKPVSERVDAWSESGRRATTPSAPRLSGDLLDTRMGDADPITPDDISGPPSAEDDFGLGPRDDNPDDDDPVTSR